MEVMEGGRKWESRIEVVERRREAKFLVAGNKKSCKKFTIIRLIFCSTIAQRSRRHIGKGANRQYNSINSNAKPFKSLEIATFGRADDIRKLNIEFSIAHFFRFNPCNPA